MMCAAVVLSLTIGAQLFGAAGSVSAQAAKDSAPRSGVGGPVASPKGTPPPAGNRASTVNTSAPKQPAAPKQSNVIPVPPAKDDAAGASAARQPTLPVSAPPTVTTQERAYMRQLDGFLAPARDHALATDDAVKLRDAFKAISGRDPAAGKRAMDELKDPVSRKLVQWHLLRAGYGEPTEYLGFLNANPQWPDRNQIIQRMEDAAFVQGGSARDLKAFFEQHEPRTGLGFAALASAHLVDGEKDRARAIATKAWRDYDLPTLLERGFLERFGDLLTDADHRRRFDRLTVDDPRWTADRNDKAAIARRTVALMSEAEKQKAEARLAVFTRAGGADQLIAALPLDKADLGLVFHRAVAARRAGRIDEARTLLAAAHAAPELLVNPDEWWEQRRLVAYDLLKAGQLKAAFELVRLPAPLTVNPLKDQTFMAGWIASRYLGDAKTAITHFRDLRKAADGPLSRAKGDYWLARTATVVKDEGLANQHYKSATANFDTFYGQLSRQLLDRSEKSIKVEPPQTPSTAEVSAFVDSDATRAVVIARKAGLDLSVTRAFLNHFRTTLKGEGEIAMAAHLADALGDTQMAVRIGKHAIARGQNLVYYAYPVHTFPQYQPLRPPPETALLFAITRQESEFNPATVSGAGARGLMQVMPVTARHVCRDYKIKCELDKVGSNPAYNAQLASAYIADRMQEFRGSYVLAIAGYNAGPGRARQWIREFGDPRDPKIDPVDWINRIPFEETREYVQKVLSNLQIYRARLGDQANALRLIEDLARARGSRDSKPATAED